ncbi:hypothetical protein GIB67_013344 [Kingdonia uniflora]|uniref:Uncharacterized protein n=1 Tax=Kingdonia uniflora TaxID=39325 RepID=A0A7J7LQR9_9MAGN|nr:hypothetical protein GIB67_013344 [Kingdonia uniflora]
MVSDQEIANGVENILRQTYPNAVNSINGVIQQLEAKLGLDLSHKSNFIRAHIDTLLHTRPPPPPIDYFALQNHPQFQNPNPQFAHNFVNRHPQDLNFTYPSPQHQQQQQHHSLLQPHSQHPPFQLHEPQLQPQPQPQLQPQPQPQAQARQRIQVPVRTDDGVGFNVAVTASTPKTPKESAPAGTKRRGGPGGLNKVCNVSPLLQAIVGEPALPRTQIVKQLWAYIRKNNLQDPSNKRKIICNDELRLVFETDCTDMFKMNKLLAKHITSLEPKKEESGSESKRQKVEKEIDSATETTKAEPSPPMVISDALERFIGTGAREMSQSKALCRVWEYIKANQLEDPLDTTAIICDVKLRELFGCESLSSEMVSQLLGPHFFSQS